MLDTLVHIPNVGFSNEAGNKASIKMSNKGGVALTARSALPLGDQNNLQP